jgi:hypothetical protein
MIIIREPQELPPTTQEPQGLIQLAAGTRNVCKMVMIIIREPQELPPTTQELLGLIQLAAGTRKFCKMVIIILREPQEIQLTTQEAAGADTTSRRNSECLQDGSDYY